MTGLKYLYLIQILDGVAVQHFTSLEFRQYLLPQQSELIASETTLQFGHFENTK
jgi:hypothetical protein